MKRTMLGLLAIAALPGLLLLGVSLIQFALRLPHLSTAYAAFIVTGVALPCAFAIGLPGHLLLRRLGWQRLRHYLAGGVWAGIGLWCVVALPFDIPQIGAALSLPVAVVAGTLAAAAFWMIVVRPASSAPGRAMPTADAGGAGSAKLP